MHVLEKKNNPVINNLQFLFPWDMEKTTDWDV